MKKSKRSINERLSSSLSFSSMSIISIPFIRSIAEMKVKGLNNAFDEYGILLKAYLEQED